MGDSIVKGKRLWETPENLRIASVKMGNSDLKVNVYGIKGKLIFEKCCPLL